LRIGDADQREIGALAEVARERRRHQIGHGVHADEREIGGLLLGLHDDADTHVPRQYAHSILAAFVRSLPNLVASFWLEVDLYWYFLPNMKGRYENSISCDFRLRRSYMRKFGFPNLRHSPSSEQLPSVFLAGLGIAMRDGLGRTHRTLPQPPRQEEYKL
jgi:hypothetical protein